MRRTLIVQDRFTFDELEPSVQEQVLERLAQSEGELWDFDWCYDTFETAAKILGITFDTINVPLYGGGTRTKIDVSFRGFWSQGDGLCYSAEYEYRKGSCDAIRKEFRTDTRLHRIADDLAQVQKRNFYLLTASVAGKERYFTHDVEVSKARYLPGYGDIEYTVSERDTDDLTEALTDFADWMYRYLEDDYEYRVSEESLKETIAANDWEFSKEGDIL